MAKIRVYNLAHELDMDSKEVIEILNDLDIEVSSHMSTITDETAELVKDMYADDSQQAKEEVKAETVETNSENKEKKEAAETDNEAKAKTDEAEADQEAVEIETPITVKEFAEEIGEAPNNLIVELMNMGVMANVNQSLDEDTLELLSEELGIKIKFKSEEEEKVSLRVGPEIEDKAEDLETRPPIVTVMGHVDHGKTTLLDSIRESRVAGSEAGGITQHIGAYQAEVDNKRITFIDTPGHEAFTAMRARGAQLTDIAILVVAADDGIMPQTEEAINHAKAAGIPIIVAINKIDKANAQPDRVKQELTEYGLVPEDWGGNTICVNVSALQQQNIGELLEMIILVSEMEELKANPNRLAEGIVIEAELDKGRGPVATVLIKNGTLEVGDPILAGLTSGRVRAMFNEFGDSLDVAGPSAAVEVLGFNEVPAAGDFVQVLENERQARDVASDRQDEKRQSELKSDAKVSLDDLYKQIQEGEVKELNIIIKADVQGSIEALRASLERLGTEEVTVNVIHTGVGGVNETDVNLASASNAIIIGFNVRPDNNALKAAEKEKVDVRTYRVIYKALEDIKDAMAGLLDPELKEEITGRAEVRDTFKVPDVGIIAGAYITDGHVNRNYDARLIRDGVVIHEGTISSLKRFENDVREVKSGYECGIGIENYNDVKVGDIIEFYTYKEIKRTL
ncbi:translation initiation factor IF-2 [Halanaerobium saccharolyticum]|uniref:Translation initiation factor IF-2 n=1 Tax=Halanaerobium saccharolyticum TaxID=43595 RepID=A0A4R7Z6I7_9FIRM|nr:translation initiation factor IF-2 [Halanaerobium saccharolyticum]RAK11130.1 translation initiation factor IF-2 [Halanaerobium saccharolyticum]TDW06981.1 translation initiation factor IF-2 [Halanaerobium saccharolyticum]TDX63746.1 translation initiation factor IF-2 [Halanaerobium saccharolyticum]